MSEQNEQYETAMKSLTAWLKEVKAAGRLEQITQQILNTAVKRRFGYSLSDETITSIIQEAKVRSEVVRSL